MLLSKAEGTWGGGGAVGVTADGNPQSLISAHNRRVLPYSRLSYSSAGAAFCGRWNVLDSRVCRDILQTKSFLRSFT